MLSRSHKRKLHDIIETGLAYVALSKNHDLTINRHLGAKIRKKCVISSQKNRRNDIVFRLFPPSRESRCPREEKKEGGRKGGKIDGTKKAIRDKRIKERAKRKI